MRYSGRVVGVAEKLITIDGLKRFKQRADETYAGKGDLPKEATGSSLGLVRPDGTTITIADGVLSAILQDLSDYVTTDTLDSAMEDLEGRIDTSIGSVYKPKGSITFEVLPEPSERVLGYVYNVTNEFTIGPDVADRWLEGESGPFPANTNVVCVVDGDSYKWDVIGATMDLSEYAKREELRKYLQKTEASTTYVQKTEAESTFVDKAEADQTYVKNADLADASSQDIDALFSEIG